MWHFKHVVSRIGADSRASSDGGFTLIEVLVSVIILVMLCTAVFFALQTLQKNTIDTGEYNQALGLSTTIAEELRDNYTSSISQVPIPADSLGSTSIPASISISPFTSPVTTKLGNFSCSITVKNDNNNYPNYTITVTDPNGRIATVVVDDPAILGE